MDIGCFQHNAFGQYGLRIQAGISTHESMGVVPGHLADIPAQGKEDDETIPILVVA